MSQITICAFVADINDEQKEAYAVVADQKVEFFNNDGSNIQGKFNLKGFRTEELKALWQDKVIGTLNMNGFDPVI